MRWPLMWRAAHEVALAEVRAEALAHATDMDARLADAREQIDYLRTELATARDNLTRISRREVGLPETPSNRAKREIDPMPARLRQYCESAGSRSTQQNMKSIAHRRHAQGETWDEIMADTMPKPKEE